MEIKLNKTDSLTIKTDDGELKINSNWGKISFSGDTSFKNMDDLEYNNQMEILKTKFMESGAFDKDKEWEILKNKIDEITEFASKYLELDRSMVLQALERRRDYCMQNYYSNLNNKTVKDAMKLATQISELSSKLFQQQRDFDKERIELQKKITDAQGFRTAVSLVKTSLEISGSIDLWVNCPHCDKYQEIDSSDYDYDGDFETNHECESCGKWFTVEAEK